VTNRNDLFDEPEDTPRPVRTPDDRPSEQPKSDGGGTPSPLSRRNFLLGAGGAAVAGAVVGAGVAVGLGAFSDGDDGAASEQAITLGVPPGNLVAQAVVHLKVNGTDHWLGVSANETLAEVLRRHLGLTGTKIGCDRSECSACTVMLNGVAVNSCSSLAIREDGKEITTIEGLSKDGELSPVQQAFLEKMGLQCGFCTPGQIMQATALLTHKPRPSEAEIRREMSGNLCKCSAYPNILAAIQQASSRGSV
jgi:xanthine dehydrogenase YagT iron-sulfur-binding subunit